MTEPSVCGWPMDSQRHPRCCACRSTSCRSLQVSGCVPIRSTSHRRRPRPASRPRWAVRRVRRLRIRPASRQLNRVLKFLTRNPDTRRASISIYDGKETHLYAKDTPCTYALGFNIVKGRLIMYISMRSCDLVYGFCNDQYCFSRLHQLVANALQIELGESNWSIQSLHVYEKHYDLKII